MPTLPEMLAKCQGGEELDLSGQKIGTVHLRGIRFETPVTIIGGWFDDLDLTDCAGLTFRKAELFCPNDPMEYHRHRVTGCSDIRWEECEIYGDTTIPVEEQFARASLIRDTDNFAAIGCRFHHLRACLEFKDVTNFEASSNDFRDIRIDGIRGGGIVGGIINNNNFTDFYPVETGGTGDHPDCIQIWEYEKVDNGNIHIEGNYYHRGRGRPVQFIFGRGNYPGSEGFYNVTIKGNISIGALYNAIMLSKATGAVVTDNQIYWLEDRHKTWLRIEDVQGVVSGNSAPMFYGDVPADQNTINQEVWKASEPAEETLNPVKPKPDVEEPAKPTETLDQLRAKLAARDRMLDERFIEAENLFDQLRYHREERRKIEAAIEAATG